ncbi:MAG: hypothetical protein WC683_10465 [bacterium]
MSIEPRFPALLRSIFDGSLVFRPTPPGEPDTAVGPTLRLPSATVRVDLAPGEFDALLANLAFGALTKHEVQAAVKAARVAGTLAAHLQGAAGDPQGDDWPAELARAHALDRMAMMAVQIIDRAQRALLSVEPLTEIHFDFTEQARAALAISFEAMSKRGEFPLPPRGRRRFDALARSPSGALHFVSASDLDAGYFYTMGIALSPEAQALQTLDASYGLDGELIVPGQAVSPIPPFLAMASRLVAASIPASSNISEEEQSIPMRNFPHPTNLDDLEPRRGGLFRPPMRPTSPEQAITDLRLQFRRSDAGAGRMSQLEGMPNVGAVFEVTGWDERRIVRTVSRVLADAEINRRRASLALYLNIESACTDRLSAVNRVVDAASELGLHYVAVADDVEDSWLPGLLEYLEPDELNEIADHSDAKHVIVIDGRPVDPIYTAATAAQRIQSVFSTLSVDVLKMGMWLCLDAMAARNVWREILANPHIPSHMLLMPIGIIEPWNAFADNRRADRTQRAIIEPFEKIKFMIEEARALGMPSLLTDTRHKSTWVLLGRKTDKDQPHLRERFVYGAPGEILGRTPDSAIPLLSWDEFMQCECLAREAKILLGQAGSIEAEQAFRIISETTYDAAHDHRNPATAIWTAETERVLRVKTAVAKGDLDAQRSSAVSPFLAVINRGHESHAKLDGWLRYLEEQGRELPDLRLELRRHREDLAKLLEAVMASQATDPNRHQQEWDAYRQQYLQYHELIKKHFVRVQMSVATAWAEA